MSDHLSERRREIVEDMRARTATIACGESSCPTSGAEGAAALIMTSVFVSVGLTELEADDTAEDLIARADAAMYRRRAQSRPAGARFRRPDR